MSITVDVLPCVLDHSLALDALAGLDNDITLIAGSSLLTGDLSYGSLGTVVAWRAEGTKVFAGLLVHLEEGVLRAELALARARLTVTQPARVALREAVAVAATHSDLLDFRLEELSEGQRVELAIAPRQSVEAFGDVFDRVSFPSFTPVLF